jgi:hypothetical protein
MFNDYSTTYHSKYFNFTIFKNTAHIKWMGKDDFGNKFRADTLSGLKQTIKNQNRN